MNTLKAVLFALVLVLATPLVLAQETADEVDVVEPRVCVNSNLVRNFDALTDQHIFVEERHNRFYLMTMWHRCIDLRNAQAIAISDVTSRVCSDGFGEILYRDRLTGRLESCRIDKIEPVASKDEAREIIEARKEAKRLGISD